MISYSPIDTLQITKRLQNTGVKPEAAEEFAEILKEREELSLQNLVTRKDLKQEIANLKNELTIRLGVMIGVAVAVVTWLDKIIQ